MKKDAYFFPHFSNARHDRKLKRVIKELGVEGYGIYFMLLEVLREQIDFKYPMEDIDLLADEFGTSEQKVRTVLCNYKLFDIDEDEKVFSMKLVFYMQPYIEKSERARLAARIRWDKVTNEMSNANAYANALPEHCNSDANAMQGEEKRGEESKEDNIDRIVSFYKDNCTNLPQPKAMSATRKSHIKARLSEYGVDIVEEVLLKANESDFLKGINDKKWKPGFDWFFNATNFVKIFEGNYDNKSVTETKQKNIVATYIDPCDDLEWS